MDNHMLRPGEKVGPYTIECKIGSGGMGEVYEAFEESLQRKLAIKILSQEASKRPDLVNRFKGEGRALARLEHGNVVRVYALGEHNDQLYIAMEYVDGWTLDEYLNENFFGLSDILRLATHMLEGLAAAHGAGIVHRDIKPQNVMVDRQLNAKLLDFGIAKLNEDSGGTTTIAGMMLGTLNYIAPEIFNGDAASKQSDIYSLGLVFYHMLTGKSPFLGKTRLETVEKVTNTKLTFSAETNAILPAALRKIILKMTSKAPHERYQSARDVLEDLRKVDLRELPPELRPSLTSQMEIDSPDDIRNKCSRFGLEFLEIRIVVCLAAEITLKSQSWSGPDNIKISDQALSEAVRRYVTAKRQMIVKYAYESPNFRLAVGGLISALVIAGVVVISSSIPVKNQSQAVAPLPVPEFPVTLPAHPVEHVKAAEPVTPPPVVAKPKPSAPPKSIAKAPPAPPAKKPKKSSERAPAAAIAAPPKAKSIEPDFLQQKPTLLPPKIERRRRSGQ